MRRMVRRRRRVPRARVVVGAIALLVALVAVVGGALRAGSESTGFVRALNLSYGAQLRPVAVASLTLAHEVRAVLDDAPRDTRASLHAALDGLVVEADGLATRAALAATPAPSQAAGARVSAAMNARVQALRVLRRTVERVLEPSPPSGASGGFLRFGALVGTSDLAYEAGRRSLDRSPGGARLPGCAWSGVLGRWSTARARGLARALTHSSSLAPVHRVGLVRAALALTPAPVPSPASHSPATPSQSPGHPPRLVLPPTGRVGVDVTVANWGNVAERGVVVHATLSGTREVRTVERAISVDPGASVAVDLPAFHVVPANIFALRVWIDPPLQNLPGTVTEESRHFRVAPPAPPVVSELLPPTGLPAGGSTVTILGSGFTWVNGVVFGSRRASYTVVSSNEIVALAPSGTRAVEVRVENPGGTSLSSAASRFEYRST